MSQLAELVVKVYTVSLGCPKNRVDTERLLGTLGTSMVPVESAMEADLTLINTCGFIQPAVEESVNTILEAVQDIAEAAKNAEKKPLLAVAGCLVSRYGQDLKDEIPEVDLWLNTEEIELWPAMAAEALTAPVHADTPRRLSTNPSYAYLKISEGCSHNCRFCTIPSIRGAHKSWPVDFLVKEAEKLAREVPEIIVVGQDSTAYGSDLDSGDDIRPLVEGLSRLSGLEWLRIMYLYPAGLTENLLAFLKDIGKPFLPYFDICTARFLHPPSQESLRLS